MLLAAAAVLSIGCGSEKESQATSNQLLIQAREAVVAGDTEKAMAALDGSIASKPTVWAYFERARLSLQSGDEQAALQDCHAALQMSPEDQEVLWLKGEIEKPVDKRFQGEFKNPPSYRK